MKESIHNPKIHNLKTAPSKTTQPSKKKKKPKRKKKQVKDLSIVKEQPNESESIAVVDVEDEKSSSEEGTFIVNEVGLRVRVDQSQVRHY